jgi:outer membrane lipase/esterase
MFFRCIFVVLVLSLSAISHAASFSSAYFFGDNYSDSGAYSGLVPAGGKFTTNPGLVWSEFLANAYGLSATPNNPNNPTILSPGTNYAQGGAQVNTGPGYGGSISTTALSVHQQVSNFLTANPTVNSHALVGLWAGTNDVFYQLQFAGTLSQAATFAAANNFAAAQAAANVALTQANSTTEATRQAAMTAAANAALLAAQANSASGVARSAQQAAADAQQFAVLAASETVKEIARLKAAGVKYIIVPNLPDFGATPAGVASGGSAAANLTLLSGLYNTRLSDDLLQSRLQVISLNVNSFMKEILANSTAYGITNTISPACNSSSSLICTPSDLASANAASSYFFADGIHPTTAVHEMLAQYAMSVMNAPLLMAQLPDSARQNARMQKIMLDDRLQLLRSEDIKGTLGLDLYVNSSVAAVNQNPTNGSSDTSINQRNITMGGDYRPGEKAHLGCAVTLSNSSYDFGNSQGGFDLDELAFSLYGGVIAAGFYTQGYAQLAFDHYDNINRIIRIGPATRIETADTSGTRLAAGINGGYNHAFGLLNTGPLIGLHYNETTVKGFSEQAGSSLSMNYDEQKSSSLTGSLGWRVDLKLEALGLKWLPFVQMEYDHQFNNGSRDISAGLRSASTHFAMPVATPDGDYLRYKSGVAIGYETWNGMLSYSGVSGMDNADFRAINLTLSKSF